MTNVRISLRDKVGKIVTQPLNSSNYYFKLGHRINRSFITLRRFIFKNL